MVAERVAIGHVAVINADTCSVFVYLCASLSVSLFLSVSIAHAILKGSLITRDH